MLRRLAPLTILAIGCAHAPWSLEHPEDLAREGFPSPVLAASIDGKPMRFLVDTGAGVHTLARWAAKAAGLRPTRLTSTATDSTGREMAIDRAETVLGVEGRDVPVALIVVDFPPVFERLQIAGLLSPQLLAPPGLAAVLDERAGTLTFDSLAAATGRTGAVPLPGARVCGQGSIKPNRLYAAPVRIGARTVMLELDSGATVTSLKRGSPAAAALEFREQGSTMGVSGERVVTERATAEVAFGGMTRALGLQVVPGQPGGCEGDGLLGQDVLARCILVLRETGLAAGCK
ncbi:MAG: aspartyl protease family protein [Myxococcales bacterium]|nr:aspartyl protease family protein [Myxococcales bacterium]